MYANKITSLFKQCKSVISPVRSYRVTVVGGASKLGQSVCFLLRGEPGISCLNVYDSSPQVHDLMTELKHIPAEQADLVTLTDEEELCKALQCTDIAVATCGVPESVELSPQDHFYANAALINMIAYHIARIRPMPFVGIATEPINTLVPIASEIMQRQGKLEPRKLFGITGEDALRAQAMYGELHMINPLDCSVPVICGHTSSTVVPLLSQATPHRPMTVKNVQTFTDQFRKLSQELHSKDGTRPGVASAYSVLLFTRAIMRAFDSKAKPIIHAFMENNDFGTDFFAGRMRLTPDGASDMERYTNISEYECNLLQRSIRNLRSELCEVKKILNSEELN